MERYRDLYKSNRLLISKKELRNQDLCSNRRIKRSAAFDAHRNVSPKLKESKPKKIKKVNNKENPYKRLQDKSKKIVSKPKPRPFVVGVVRHKIHSPPFLHGPLKSAKPQNNLSCPPPPGKSFAPRNYKFNAPTGLKVNFATPKSQTSPFTLRSLFKKEEKVNTKAKESPLRNVTVRRPLRQISNISPLCSNASHFEKSKGKELWTEPKEGMKDETPVFGRLNLLKIFEASKISKDNLENNFLSPKIDRNFDVKKNLNDKKLFDSPRDEMKKITSIKCSDKTPILQKIKLSETSFDMKNQNRVLNEIISPTSLKIDENLENSIKQSEKQVLHSIKKSEYKENDRNLVINKKPSTISFKIDNLVKTVEQSEKESEADSNSNFEPIENDIIITNVDVANEQQEYFDADTPIDNRLQSFKDSNSKIENNSSMQHDTLSCIDNLLNNKESDNENKKIELENTIGCEKIKNNLNLQLTNFVSLENKINPDVAFKELTNPKQQTQLDSLESSHYEIIEKINTNYSESDFNQSENDHFNSKRKHSTSLNKTLENINTIGTPSLIQPKYQVTITTPSGSEKNCTMESKSYRIIINEEIKTKMYTQHPETVTISDSPDIKKQIPIHKSTVKNSNEVIDLVSDEEEDHTVFLSKVLPLLASASPKGNKKRVPMGSIENIPILHISPCKTPRSHLVAKEHSPINSPLRVLSLRNRHVEISPSPKKSTPRKQRRKKLDQTFTQEK